MLNGGNSKKIWRVVITDYAQKQVARIPHERRFSFYAAFEEMEQNPWRGDVKKVTGGSENVWRRRIGSYRMIFEILSDERIVFVYDIVRRTSKTY